MRIFYTARTFAFSDFTLKPAMQLIEEGCTDLEPPVTDDYIEREMYIYWDIRFDRQFKAIMRRIK